jgi:hypothetical protein
MLNLDFLTVLPDVSAPGSREWLNHGTVHTNGPVMDDELLADPVIAGNPFCMHARCFAMYSAIVHCGIR